MRAYSDSLTAGLSNAKIVEKRLCRKLSFSIDYQIIGKLKYVLDDYEAKIISEDYKNCIDIILAVPETMTERFKKYMIEITGADITINDEGTYFL